MKNSGNTTRKITATWRIELLCDCPACSSYVDLLNAPDFWDGRNFQVGEHDTKRTQNVDVVCPDCGHEMLVDLEY